MTQYGIVCIKFVRDPTLAAQAPFIRNLAENRMVIFAVLVILLMRFYRQGINGLLQALRPYGRRPGTRRSG